MAEMGISAAVDQPANRAGLGWVYVGESMESTATLRELLERARAGDQAAVVEIVGRFREHALELARTLVGDGHLAEDAVQQAFVRAIGSLGSLRETGAFPAWLRQIVRTECDHIRRRRTRRCELPCGCEDATAGECAGERDSPLDVAISRELAEVVRQAVRTLPAASREVAELYYLDERSCGEVAGILQVPEGTVKRRLYNARELLRQELSGLLGDTQGRRS